MGLTLDQERKHLRTSTCLLAKSFTYIPHGILKEQYKNFKDRIIEILLFYSDQEESRTSKNFSLMKLDSILKIHVTERVKHLVEQQLYIFKSFSMIAGWIIDPDFDLQICFYVEIRTIICCPYLYSIPEKVLFSGPFFYSSFKKPCSMTFICLSFLVDEFGLEIAFRVKMFLFEFI